MREPVGGLPVAGIQFKLRSLLLIVLFVAMALGIILLSIENARERQRGLVWREMAEVERMRTEASLRQAEVNEQKARQVAEDLSRQLQQTKTDK
jgi:hypothetical protein